MPAARQRKRVGGAGGGKKIRMTDEPDLSEVPDVPSDIISEPPSEVPLPAPEPETTDPFEEPPPKPPPKRKRNQKKDDSGKKKKGDGAGPRRGKTDDDLLEGSLFDVVRAGKASLQAVVDDWIESYKADRDAALLDLIQFFIQCSGCKGKITPYMYANMEHAEIIRKMTEEFDEDSGDYPLIMSGPQWKKFKQNFNEFVQVLVRQCQYSIIYDQYMMDNVISLLTGLTDSQVRAFRHTSTLAAMKLMTALVDVALNLSINLDNTQRQYESERAKQQSKRATDRLDLLMTKRQELEENQAEIRNMLTYIFKGVFVHRYRDTQPEIRSICMMEIGVWMKKYPFMFLDDSYLKYVGWLLYDKVGDVRSWCLKTLSPLYDSYDLSGKLELFTNRFKDRIVEMTLDKEYDVAVQAVKLVVSILRYSDNVLSDKDSENVYELVYSSHRQVAQAAGDFLNTKLFKRDDEATKNLKSAKGKKRSPNTPLIRDLVLFFIESELHEHAAYLVDSLWEINEMMKDWECMTDLLLEEPGRGEEALDDRQETSLIEIMVCCVKQAATGESPVGRGPNRKLTAKETKQVLEDKTKLTEHFIVTLPQLLLKYLMDPEKVANLLLIPLYFDLDIYTSSRQEKHLELLLRYLQETVDKHTDTEVLEACAKCFEYFCSDEYAVAGKCDVARKTVIDGLTVKFREALQDYFTEGEQPDDDETFALAASLKRMYAFNSCHDLSSWDVWEDVFHIVKTANEHGGMPEEIICSAMSTCSMYLLWGQQALDEHNPDKEQMKLLRRRLNELMKNCHDLMFHQLSRVNEEAYVTICDLLVVFSKHLGENAVMKPLVYEPDKNMHLHLSNFLSEKVFVEDDDDDVDENVKIEELHKRRNFLACFCKLIVYNIVSIKVGADMFKHYMKFYNDYGDIIKATLSKAREINKITTAKTLALSLTQLFKELQVEQGQIERSSDAFQSIKELARRFALSFGLDQVKNREAVAAMHREGIIFSLLSQEGRDPADAPHNIAFLEVLCEFTNKLMKQDKKTVVQYLDKQLPQGMPVSGSEEWQPLLTYRNSLVQGEGEINPITLKEATKRRYGKRKQDGGSQPKADDSGFEPQTPAPMTVPPLTSTVQKRRRIDETISEQGSEQDFVDDTSSAAAMGMTQSQVSWLNSQKQQQEMQRTADVTYGRGQHQQVSGYPQQHSVPSESDQASNISEFSSPVPTPQTPQGYYHHPQQHQQQLQQQHPQQQQQHPQQGQFYGGGLLGENHYVDDASARHHIVHPQSSDVNSHQGY
ncbi:LOW QUALITY PROTEIN: cohesin subunit SA-2-like [Haliotis rubra]|uniref:LOW QUALITY PROTEIN: cohesin subunit SA-2-like n=1 Tax=Haliotis rubra TaxID=36100 RepID=UPI001EE59C9B|nr:LOW QUALITY PROTEIN: cohesin subunit SA-2-like [Haliotis rubra]